MMWACCRRTSPQFWLWSGLTLVYFVLYPHDLIALLAPVEVLSTVAMRLIGNITTISAWLYLFASVCVIAWTAIAITDRIMTNKRGGS